HRFAPNTAWCEWARANGCLPTQEEEVDAAQAFETMMQERMLADEEEGEEEEEDANEDDQTNDLKCSNFDDIAALNLEESNEDRIDGLSATTSETVPSFAKYRYPIIDGEEDYDSWDPYERKYTGLEMASQRITVWEPDNYRKPQRNSVFYFIEVLTSQHHRDELGQRYTTLFTEPVLHEKQIHAHSGQTSSACQWFAFYTNPCPSYYSYQSYPSSVELNKLFEDTSKELLLADFWSWSELDGQCTGNIFRRLFFEGQRHRGDFTCFLDADSDSDSKSEGFGRLFDLTSSEHEDAPIEVERRYDNSEQPSLDLQSEVSSNQEDLPSQVDSSPSTDAQRRYSEEHSNQSARCLPPPSSATYSENDEFCPLMRDCKNCHYDFNTTKQLINTELAPQLRWMFRQTRWPIRFAPQQ
ncbi:unnamed protein product, partial [Hydatigera taeniaeformis]|uniref:Myotubularin phosphatase domain-containing protein n=1 Tax=Hydatigena taeniaeformis TaxID=6205 RepID=A0A0R3WWN0_HYDTA